MPLRTRTTWWGIVLDAPEPPVLARFYARLLGWQVVKAEDTWATVVPPGESGYYIAAQYEPHYARPVWPSVEGQQQISMHLDIEVEELETAVAHALSVGAELAEFQPQDKVRVMLDPVGHAFCLYLGASAQDTSE
jgi:hypothetical protein